MNISGRTHSSSPKPIITTPLRGRRAVRSAGKKNKGFTEGKESREEAFCSEKRGFQHSVTGSKAGLVIFGKHIKGKKRARRRVLRRRRGAGWQH